MSQPEFLAIVLNVQAILSSLRRQTLNNPMSNSLIGKLFTSLKDTPRDFEGKYKFALKFFYATTFCLKCDFRGHGFNCYGNTKVWPDSLFDEISAVKTRVESGQHVNLKNYRDAHALLSAIDGLITWFKQKEKNKSPISLKILEKITDEIPDIANRLDHVSRLGLNYFKICLSCVKNNLFTNHIIQQELQEYKNVIRNHLQSPEV